MTKQQTILMVTLFFVGIAGRLLPHFWNATPVAAIILFAGWHIGARSAALLGLSIMAVSDYFIGFYRLELLLAVYGSFALVAVVSYLIRRHLSWTTVFFASIISSTLFYLITNWAVWHFSPWYAKSLEGLVICYTLALPFFRATLTGDLFYVGALFGAYQLVVVRQFQLKPKTLQVNH